MNPHITSLKVVSVAETLEVGIKESNLLIYTWYYNNNIRNVYDDALQNYAP